MSSKKKTLVGIFCLPTATRFHCSERERSGAFASGQVSFVLSATQSVEDGGYPPAVVLTADEGMLELDLGSDVDTQHAEVRKNLPPRRVTGVLLADGTVFGTIPGKGEGLPHWEYISPNIDETSGSPEEIQAVKDRVTANRSAKAASKAKAA